MSNACLDQLVLQWTADSKAHTVIYPTTLTVAGYTYTQNTVHDVVSRALSHADANGVQVYVGLQTNSDWFVNYANNTSWLNNEATIAEALANDLWSKYGSHASFAGWYLSFEMDNLNEPTQTQWDAMVSFYTTVGNYLHNLSSGKPIIIAPFFNTAVGMSASGYQTMWQYILSRSPIDIVALQDGIGAGHATVNDLPTWYQAVQNAICQWGKSIHFWSDAETYVSNNGFHPGSIGQLVADMRAEDPYVSNFLSFSYNHYMSPQQVLPAYQNTYLNYLSTLNVEATPPSVPTGVSATAVNSITVNLSWTASTDNFGVVGYQLYRNGMLVTTLYGTSTSFSDSQLNPSTTYTYKLAAFDAAGNVSSQTTMSTGRKLAWSISQRLEMALWRRNIASLTCPESVAATCKSRCSLRALRGLLSTRRRCCNSDCGNMRGKGGEASPSLLV